MARVLILTTTDAPTPQSSASMLIRGVLLGGSLCLITTNSPLRTAGAFAVLGYLATTELIPRVGPQFKRIGLSGRDLLKPPRKDGKPSEPLPESMGLVAAVTYFFVMLFLIPFVFFKYLVMSSASDDSEVYTAYATQYESLNDNQLFPHNKLSTFLSALLCLICTTFLGFCDDLFDIRWRHKFFLPAIAAIPLLIVYYVDFSVTSVVVPTFVTNSKVGNWLLVAFNWMIWGVNTIVTRLSGLSFSSLPSDYEIPEGSPKLLDLGIFYYVYMAAIAIFAPNAINILAGINGLEVGQSVVLGVVLLLNDLLYITNGSVSLAARESHLLSAIFLIPFLGVALGVLRYNWFPARVFVGDTFCYFAGMVFAVVGISGHFSKTLLLFLLPQIINFIYSVPQLFHLVPCPRHRMPRLNAATGNLEPSYGELAGGESIDGDANTPPSSVKTRWATRLILLPLETFRLIDLKRDEKGQVVEFSNMTMINWLLVTFGPMKEDSLCLLIMGLQFVTGILMIFIRHTLGPWLFGYDNFTWGVSDGSITI
ncbi:hypothetical protein DIURU_005260 [Diutina rugosa]|uniref:UDP-N-acetylglucosamine--dolichyl-phosphate N-acetylglucosaminephosphotransferase n=1 Tax=Diutina rugosa TaxID=5481 RepID=A0A642UDR6_DIURU|nr:uncharacterized protein DIURU_005260 [Diutina rugosa]KAA8897283.1 hypothetical protein DIURU_005260 [Diutina rugosa]